MTSEIIVAEIKDYFFVCLFLITVNIDAVATDRY